MNLLAQAFFYVRQRPHDFAAALAAHLRLSLCALGVALVMALPLGLACARSERLARVLTPLLGVSRAVPSLAVLALVLPFTGAGFRPALIALALLGVPSILINTQAGFRQVSPSAIEAAQGMGLNPLEVLRNVEWPLALPSVLAGVRLATVEIIAGASLAAFIGGGGLGSYIVNGLTMYDFRLLLVGALPVAILALGGDGFWAFFEHRRARSWR